MEVVYNEEKFYKEDGWPTESFLYCSYLFYTGEGTQFGPDYDQFALVENALYPYIRLTKKRERSHFPCGGSSQPATDGTFARLSETERNTQCPKIAWGFAAVYLATLCFDKHQQDYVEREERDCVIKDYYSRYLTIYLESHNGLKYAKVSIEQKELDFLAEHEKVIKELWERCTPLKKYPMLYDYACDAELEYEEFLKRRKAEIMNSIKGETVSGSNNSESRTITQHGNNSVYIEKNEGQIVITPSTTKEKSDVADGKMRASNEVKFAEIENRILDYLNMASASIDVCVAWFTITELRDKLLEKACEGVKVRVIIYKDGVNHSKGVDLTGLNHKEYRGERGGIMHNKFCVIDNVHTICGSYNWTRNAEDKNDEDAAFHFEDYKFASEYTKRFNQMWERDGCVD